ncbi:TetR family transcriptional regulator [Phytohabitans rumicis]|uniref:TetR family transcriptional regulator n=1 Tax=Phytohabitans rumicis TaxID=1076125 RepID=A0A6V8L7X1_9ACTN|nr:TetR family transcriptional regulator [Phytohabitans rumicis]
MSNSVILEIATSQFAERGYEGTTMRTIAQEAGVNTALIHHFFLTKEGLFEAVVRDALSPPDLVTRVLDGPRGRVGERTVRHFFTFWDVPAHRARLAGVLRSVTAVEGAADEVRNFLGDEVLFPLTEALGQPNARLRAAMAGTQLIGLATSRYIFRIGAIESVSAEQLAATTGRTFQTYLTGAL